MQNDDGLVELDLEQIARILEDMNYVVKARTIRRADNAITRLRAERDAALRDRASIVAWVGTCDPQLADAIEAFADREDG